MLTSKIQDSKGEREEGREGSKDDRSMEGNMEEGKEWKDKITLIEMRLKVLEVEIFKSVIRRDEIKARGKVFRGKAYEEN